MKLLGPLLSINQLTTPQIEAILTLEEKITKRGRLRKFRDVKG